MRVCVLLSIAAFACTAGYGAQPAGTPTPAPDNTRSGKPWNWALDETYEQRCEKSPQAQPLSSKSLVLPYPNVINLSPDIQEKDSLALGIRSVSNRSEYIWKIIPLTDKHQAYFDMRKKLMAEKKDRELLDWCEKNGLPECAELELRRMLLAFRENFQQTGYQPLNKKWQTYADKNQSPFCFPLPLEGEWYVVPDTTGHHRMKASAAYAFDMTIQKNGLTFKNHPSKLENYFSWEQPVLAQADGIVTSVSNDFPDMVPGQVGSFGAANSIVINYGGGISVMYAHLRKGSAKVKAGDRVKPGQVVGLVGNSGASGMPHLHFTMLDTMFSVRGRFRFEVKNGTKWDTVDGENLKEGTYVRNVDAVFKEK